MRKYGCDVGWQMCDMQNIICVHIRDLHTSDTI